MPSTVGRDQLHARLSQRPDVVFVYMTDIRALDPPPARAARLIVIDVSFISLSSSCDRLAPAARPAWLVAADQTSIRSWRALPEKGIVRDAVSSSRVRDIAAWCIARLAGRGVSRPRRSAGARQSRFLLAANSRA